MYNTTDELDTYSVEVQETAKLKQDGPRFEFVSAEEWQKLLQTYE